MGRESIEERRARLMPGAQWLVAERKRRDLSQQQLADRLGVKQDRISAYERAQDEPPPEVVRGLAREYGMTQVEVWRCLHKPLPAEFVDEEAEAVYYARKYPEAWRRLLPDDPLNDPPDAAPRSGRKQRHSRVRPRKGDEGPDSSQERASGA